MASALRAFADATVDLADPEVMNAAWQHRAVGVPDILVAATAQAAVLTVLHHDGAFDLIANITGQGTE